MRASRNTCAGTMEVATIVPDVNFILSALVGCENMLPHWIPETMMKICLSGFKNGRRVSEENGRWGVQSVRMEDEHGSSLAAKDNEARGGLVAEPLVCSNHGLVMSTDLRR